jgi:hypothetical protein
MTSAYWNGTGWTAVAAIDVTGAANNDDIRWMTLKADPTSDDLQATIVSYQAAPALSSLHTTYWNGSAWTLTSNIDTAIDIATTARAADFSWLPSGGVGKLMWDTDAAATTLSVINCSPICNASNIETIPSFAGTGRWITAFRNPDASDLVDFIGLRLISTNAFFAFGFDGTNFFNYSGTINANTGSATYEVFGFSYNQDHVAPSINFSNPTPANGQYYPSTFININTSSNEVLSIARLELDGTNYTMNSSLASVFLNWFYNFTVLEGFHEYKIYFSDLIGHSNVSETRNFTATLPPNITIYTPLNNSLNLSNNITFNFSVHDTIFNLTICSLYIDNVMVENITNDSSPIPKDTSILFNQLLKNGQHNWSINCTDEIGFNGSVGKFNLTTIITPIFLSSSIGDGFSLDGQIMLSAGSIRQVNCSMTASDPEGIDNLKNATGKFYYFLNKSSDSDDASVHYSNSSCVAIGNTSSNKTFTCSFDVLYYANNGTWNCNISVFNNYSNFIYSNISTVVQPLYAINLTDGVDFSNVPTGGVSVNITANITNFGNMLINLSLQGYAVTIGDNVGMNCSDQTNISIGNIRFSTNATANYTSKNALNGSIQPINFQLKKQTTVVQISNYTYWQISINPGTWMKLCEGHIIFNAEAP